MPFSTVAFSDERAADFMARSRRASDGKRQSVLVVTVTSPIGRA